MGSSTCVPVVRARRSAGICSAVMCLGATGGLDACINGINKEANMAASVWGREQTEVTSDLVFITNKS